MRVNCTKHSPKIGDVYMMEFYGRGSAQYGCRPGIIIQNNIGNQNSPNVVAVPVTSSLKKLGQPTHVFLSAKNTGLKYDSVVLCESPMSIPKNRIGSFIASLPRSYMRKIAKAFLLEHPMLGFLDNDEIADVKQESYSLIAD